MSALFAVSFLAQSALMAVDEFHFHWKRNLPRWERLGHPVDTFFFLLPFSILSFSRPSEMNQWLYGALSVFSCLIITKDEWVHRDEASPAEQWIHSVLFILHPVVLISAFFVWKESSFPFVWLLLSIFLFFLYQLTFWNFYADRIFKARLANH